MGRGEASIPLHLAVGKDLVDRVTGRVKCSHAVPLVAEWPLVVLMKGFSLNLAPLGAACKGRGEESMAWSAVIVRGIVIPSYHGVGCPL